MLTKIKIAASAALILSTASAALAMTDRGESAAATASQSSWFARQDLNLGYSATGRIPSMTKQLPVRQNSGNKVLIDHQYLGLGVNRG